MRKLIFLVILILIVAPGISKGATDAITGSEGESLFGLQDANYRFAGTGNGLRLAASKTESVQSSQSMAITSATVTFDPKKKDKLIVKGTTGSLSLTGAQSATAGIFTGLNLFIEQMDSKGKVTYSSWGDLGFGFLWGDHDHMNGTFSGNDFSGSWDYSDQDNHYSGTMKIKLDDVLQKATKVISFSVEDNRYRDGSYTTKMSGVGGDLPPPTRSTTGSYDTTTFQINGTGTCNSVTSYDYEFLPSVDWLVHTVVTDYKCNNNSLLIIQFALADPCKKKIPLPKGISTFYLDGVSSSSDEVPSAFLGSDPEEISPIGFGKKTTGGSPSSYHVKLCPFEGPVDIYFNVVPYWGDYFLDQNNKVRPMEKLKPWRTNVTGGIDEVIAGDFGGLFNGGRLPKGEHGFQIIAVPAGVNYFEADDAYFWKYTVDIKCDGYIPMPTGREFFGINQPPALPVTGSDPEQIIPFSVGHYALGGELLWMGVEFCPFSPAVDTLDYHVDIHFGIYCPEDDPLNFYFANWEAKEEKDLFQKVSILNLPFSAKLPEGAFSENDQFDTDQEDQTNIFVDIGAEASKLPKGSCQYIAAVSPVGVRDKFYAWVLPLDINIKQAFIDQWKIVHQGDGSIKEKKKR